MLSSRIKVYTVRHLSVSSSRTLDMADDSRKFVRSAVVHICTLHFEQVDT